ncbi:MAG TPA: CotH kinase family protein, partial [Clostridia bacterium]|nr:CotH kinase family protein [Clostridia bacterium]
MMSVSFASAAVRINEVMASNNSIITDEDGDYSDWIELVNTGSESVSLEGWGLSDDAAAPFRWTFPPLLLTPGKHLLVWASKKDRKPATVLENGGVLIPESAAWKYWDTGVVPTGAWQARTYNDLEWPIGSARFGYPLAAGGTPLTKSPGGQFFPSYFFRKSFVLSDVPDAEQTGDIILRHFLDDGAVLYLNGTEVFRYKMPSGEVSYTSYTGDGYNVDYNGAWLTNTLSKTLVFSLLRAGTNVCSVSLHQSKATTGDALFDLGLRFQAGSNSALHTDFKVSASGSDLYLTEPTGTTVDHVAVPVIPADFSAGRSPDGGGSWRVFPAPTPGTINSTVLSYGGAVAAVTPSVTPGFYPDTMTVSFSTPTPDAVIYYTTDGSTPTTNALRYTGPLTLSNRSQESNSLSMIHTGTAGAFNIPSFGTVWNYVNPMVVLPKARVVRAVAVKSDWVNAPLFAGTWFVGPQTGNYTLPVVSLISDYTNFFGSRGIYNNPSLASDNDWEYPLNVELFVERDRVASQLMGFRIHGGYSSGFAQKSLRLYARSEYGASTFNYPLFPDQPQHTSYKRFLLRNGGNDWGRTLVRDAAAQELCKHLRHDTQAYRPSLVFLNGEAWGIHNLRERYDERYLERVYGVDPESVDIVGFPLRGPLAVADEGSAAGFNSLLAWLTTNSLVQAGPYATVTNQVDVANFMDYMLANMFVVNKDWPGNNIKFWRTRTANAAPGALHGHDGRWRWLMFDVDFAFAGWDADPVSTDMWAWTTTTADGSGRVYESATRLFRRLLENEVFRTEMLSRYADQLNTAYLPRRTRALVEHMRDVIKPEMQGHIDRWPGGIRNLTVWTNEIERICVFARDRHGWEWRNMCTRFNLTTGEVSVATSDMAHGIVQVNSVTIDALTLGVTNVSSPYPWRGTYFQQIPVLVRALPRAGYRFVRWNESGGTNAVMSLR